MACFPKFNLHFLVWVACLPLLATLSQEKRLGRAFGLGYFSGAVFLAGSCYWFVGVMQHYGKLSPLLALGVLLLFVVIFSLFFGAFGLAECLAARSTPGAALLLSPFLWVALELARTYLITGFPWNLLGYGVGATGLRQLASATGVYGLSFLAVATSALAAWALLAPWRAGKGVALLAWLALLLAANLLLSPPAWPPGQIVACLVQPNVPLEAEVIEGWAPWRDPTQLNRLVEMSLAAAEERERQPLAPEAGEGGSRLIVWAENPAPFYFTRDMVFRTAAEGLARTAHAYLIVNTVTPAGPDQNRITNSAVVLSPEGQELLQYDKIHLVPFGEYVPAWAFRGKIGKMVSEVGEFAPGTSYRVARTPAGTIGAFICYEAIFPQLVRRLTLAGAGVLVNISDDAWYGDSAAAFQHLEMARLRAIENGRYLLRATNDGITAVIDPNGRVVSQLPRHRARVLRERFSFRAGQTFYTAHGDVFAWLSVALTGALLIWTAARRGTIS